MQVPSNHPLAPIFKDDSRYAPAAYRFVFDALTYAHEVMQLGSNEQGEEHHVTGQELCEAARLLALDQFGLMTRCVFQRWGVTRSGDFGEIVYNLIRIGQMKKTERDRREDFDDVFDFETDLDADYQIHVPKGRL